MYKGPGVKWVSIVVLSIFSISLGFSVLIGTTAISSPDSDPDTTTTATTTTTSWPTWYSSTPTCTYETTTWITTPDTTWWEPTQITYPVAPVDYTAWFMLLLFIILFVFGYWYIF